LSNAAEVDKVNRILVTALNSYKSQALLCLSLLPLLCGIALALPATQQKAAISVPNRFAVLDEIIHDAIHDQQIPGAVLLVWHNDQVVYRKALGSRSLEPRHEPMTLDTIFDVASMTKVIATTVAILQLAEKGQLRVNDPVAKYIPEFGQNGKDEITIRELLTHFSGLREDIDLLPPWEGKETALRMAYAETPEYAPGSRFLYSDTNFIVLGALVEQVSGVSLDQYCLKHIFIPLGMTRTRFLPPPSWLPKIAPTEFDEQGKMLRGVVHDPRSRRMGGVAGHAGVFSTADDLSRFALCLLSGGNPILSSSMVEKMTTAQQPPTATVLRGFGWDIDSPYSSNRGELLPVGSFGHTGFTGTSIWIDPTTRTFIILLTNAVHPHGKSSAMVLRDKVATAVAAALPLTVTEKEELHWVSITGYNEPQTAERRIPTRNGTVSTGIDVLENDPSVLPHKETGNLHIGLLTNQTGVDSQGRRSIDVLAKMPGVSLDAIFSPEHGVTGTLDTTNIGNTKDSATGVPVYSVYGATEAQRRPSADALKGLDAILIDIQDAGVRFYTYETTLAYFLEAAAKAGTEVIVLDRPNPITGSFIQGPISDSGHESFVNYFSIPVRHGMTMGELAKMFNGERNLNANLKVVPMQGWQRGDWYDSTGLAWINPSPNLRSLAEAALYPGVALVEGTNISVGRGTDTPFELLGAPWIDGRQLAQRLNAREIPGVRFVPVTFTPNASNYSGEVCGGINIILTDRNSLEAPELGIELAVALHQLYPEQYHLERMNEILLNQSVFDEIFKSEDPHRIAQDWQDALDKFQQLRQKYLIYK
jgi:uncharacterized protein YbbC (DUF1343 family)/CubicO group peptidase (beta-lactamase class C family)